MNTLVTVTVTDYLLNNSIDFEMVCGGRVEELKNSIDKHGKEIFGHLNLSLKHLIFDDIIVEDTDILFDLITDMNKKNIFFLFAPEIEPKHKYNLILKVDDASIIAAKEWTLKENEENIQTQTLNHLISHQNYTNIFKNLESPVANPQAEAIVWFDWRLLARLAIGFFLFAQGGSAGRLCCYVAGAIAYYLFEIGAFTAYCAYLRQQHLATPPAMQQQALSFTRVALAIFNTVNLPQSPGLLTDAYVLVLSFFLSLWPDWRVR